MGRCYRRFFRDAARTGAMPRIKINIKSQTLDVLEEDGSLIKRYLVSTSKHGAGELDGSYCTPRGRHMVRAKIGSGQPANTVFVERRPTAESTARSWRRALRSVTGF